MGHNKVSVVWPIGVDVREEKLKPAEREAKESVCASSVLKPKRVSLLARVPNTPFSQVLIVEHEAHTKENKESSLKKQKNNAKTTKI